LALGITKFPTQRKKIIFREKYEKTIQEWGREYVEKNLYS
jgi:hypothetical protein